MKRGISILAVCLLFALMADGHSLALDVYAEGAYNNTQLDVYIFADLSEEDAALLSFGVKISYDPNVLSVVSAVKDIPLNKDYTSNDTRWYLGENTADYRNLPDPNTTTSGEVIIIGGKLDPANPTVGVSEGNRVLLGKVCFAPVGGTMPANPEAVIGPLTYARGTGAPEDTYKNFVRFDSTDPEGEVLDGSVSFAHPNPPVGASGAFILRKRGDANADGRLDVQDYLRVRSLIAADNFPPYADCNGDGVLNVNDYLCVRSKM